MLIFSASYNSKIHHFTLQYIHLRIGINIAIINKKDHAFKHGLN